jgi:hypothetical protein
MAQTYRRQSVPKRRGLGPVGRLDRESKVTRGAQEVRTVVTLDDDALDWLGRMLAGPKDPLDPRRPWTLARALMAAHSMRHECGHRLTLDAERRLICPRCRSAELTDVMSDLL